MNHKERQAFLHARDFLLCYWDDYEKAYADFRWPSLSSFNWAWDYFEHCAADDPKKLALQIIEEDGSQAQYSFGELSRRSNQVARYLQRLGVERGDRILLVLPNHVAIWEITLAALKLGAVIVPTSTLVSSEELHDRIDRADARYVVAFHTVIERFSAERHFVGIVVGARVAGWHAYTEAYDESAALTPYANPRATDPFLLYFTSGTTAAPKLVQHTHQSYPVGHLATMYWIGIRPDDLHCNISSPGWAKHAWSSFFAPWNAGATIFVHNFGRFSARNTLEHIERSGVTTLCAPPTVWRSLVLEDLCEYRMKLRESVAAGEPLNPEIIEQVRRAWNVTVRDGYGQTETACLLANTPAHNVKLGSVGKATPGHEIVLLDDSGKEENVGEIALKLQPRPTSLFTGYMSTEHSDRRSHEYYLTGDLASRDEDGYYTYIGRSDDVFKSSDYRLSPFELESVLLENRQIAEAAVVPSPDPIRWTVPKAFIVLRPGFAPSKSVAEEIFRFIRKRMAGYKRIRRIEFSELPKTVSGKIRRAELRRLELMPRDPLSRREYEFWEEDFEDL